jgi:hypothetical protein
MDVGAPRERAEGMLNRANTMVPARGAEVILTTRSS